MSQEYTWTEIAEHNNENNSVWIVMNEKIYDVTKFIYEHPGGDDVILEWAGKDCTETFNDIGHSSDAIEMREEYLVGKVNEEK